ncbi:MAG: prolipoprotein diacylglyceryl transferase [Saprospiraceae bacterium]|nr:prolipoprotein diacylglyceryl transferase [Saprospiraceae bacterium]
MYPDLSYILHALIGTQPDNAFSIIKSFGLFLGFSFLASGYLLYLELKRKEKSGQIVGRMENIIVYKPIDWQEIGIQTFVNFIFGFKLGLIVSDFAAFKTSPEKAIFSLDGNWFWGLGFAVLTAGYWIYKMNQQKDKEIQRKDVFISPQSRLFDITGIAALTGIIGSKLFSILENLGDFFRDPIGTFFSGSGLTIYGGLILAFIIVFRYVKSKGLHPIHMMDAIAPTLMIGYCVGRMGCHISGDGDWGIVNEMAKPGWFLLPDSWWAFSYPHNVIEEGVKIEGCTWHYCTELIPKVFPTPLYESILALLITGILWFLRTRIPYAGVLFFIYALLNGIERFFIEMIRVNPRYNILGMNPSMSQGIALLLIFTGIIGIVIFWRKKIQ